MIREGGTRAFYRPAEDMIAMPDRTRFRGTAASAAAKASDYLAGLQSAEKQAQVIAAE